MNSHLHNFVEFLYVSFAGGSERRSDRGPIQIEGKMPVTEEKSDTTTEKSVTPAVTPKKEERLVKTTTQPEPVTAESGWGSGASRTSHFAFTMLLCSLILTLSNLL